MVGHSSVAFGSAVPRFGKNTQHYNLDPDGLLLSKPPGCDPALYHPQTVQQAYENINKQYVTKDVWKLMDDLKNWSQNLGYRNQKILDQRQWEKGLGGPAWTELHEPEKPSSACQNLDFGRTKRFKSAMKDSYPGPGNYYKAVPFKAPYGPHSTRPTLDREPPCRFTDTAPNYSLAPNRYSIFDPDSIENLPKRIVSLKGPYQLFTGKRDYTSIKNHFSTLGRVSAKTWPVKLPGCLEEIKKSHIGTWNKTGRDKRPLHRTANTDLAMAPRKPSDPGPTTYFEHMSEYKFIQNKQAFNSSYDKPPMYQRVVVWPGVGRYNLDKKYPAKGNGHRYVFQSKVKRTSGYIIPKKLNTF